MSHVKTIRLLPVVLLFCLWAMSAQAQTPVVSNDVPAQSFVGEQFCFTAGITNTGVTGYGPYLRLILPIGITFNTASFMSLGVTVTNVGTFPGATPGVTTGTLTDPLNNTSVTGTTGYRLYILQPPIGSVVAGQPSLDIKICATISTAAVVGTALPIKLQPMYLFGNTPTGVNGSIAGTATTANVTPSLIKFTKISNAPEGERTPGSSWPFSFSLRADIANGQTVTNVVFNDTLPANFQYDGPLSLPGGCSNNSTLSTTTPGGNLRVTCASATGTTAANELVVDIPGHIIDVLNETGCGTAAVNNNATLDATYNSSALPQASATATVTAKHVALQQSASPTILAPGATVTYTVNLQTSNFANATSLVVTEILEDGLLYNATSSLTIAGTPVAITPTVTTNANSTSTLTWDLRTALGSDVPSGSAIQLIFTAVVQQTYAATGQPVLSSDTLYAAGTATYALSAGASGCTDTSSATVAVEPVTVSKQVINPQAEYRPGDTVQYRLSMSIPAGDTNNIQFKDYFPLPVFNVAALNLTFGGTDIKLASTNTVTGITPTAISVNATENSLTLDFPTITTTSAQTLAVDIFIKVTEVPFADKLSITNILQAKSSNTNNQYLQALAPVIAAVRSPKLVLTTGVSSTNGTGTISPAATIKPVNGNLTNADAGDSVTFVTTVENIGGSGAYQVLINGTEPTSFTNCTLVSVTDGAGTALTYTGDYFAAGVLLTNPLALNDGNPAGGGSPYSTDTALVTFQCNLAADVAPGQTYTSNARAVWRSTPTATADFPPVTDSATVATRSLALTKLFVTSSEVDTSNTGPYLAIGEVVRYRLAAQIPEGKITNLTVTDSLPPGLIFRNDNSTKVAFVANGAGINSTTITTSLTGCTNLNQSGNSTTLAALPSANITCPLPAAAISPATFSDGVDPVFSLGTITNADSDADAEFVVVEFNAVVANTGTAGNSRTNNFFTRINGSATGAGGTSGNVLIYLAEPNINNLAHSVNATTGQAGQQVTFTATWTNTNSSVYVSPAYDVRLTDLLPTGISLDIPSINATLSGGATGLSTNSTGQNLDLTIAKIPPGGSVTVTFKGTLTQAVEPGTHVDSTVNLVWSSLPGTNGTASNPTGSNAPGAPGAVDGERTYSSTKTAQVNVPGVGLTKTVQATNQSFTGTSKHNASLTDLAIGEQVTFRITATLPEGTAPMFKITDVLPSTAVGVLGYVSSSVVSVGANLTATTPAPTPTVTDANLGDGVNDTMVWDFGQVVNAIDGVSDSKDRIVVDVVAVVLPKPANANADALTNTAVLQYGTGLIASANATVELVEPALTFAKTGSVTTAQAGQEITFTIDVSHLASSTADSFDLTINDVLPTGLTYVANSLSDNGTTPATSLNIVNGNITAVYTNFPLGSVGQIQFKTLVDTTVTPGQAISNQANATYYSLATDPNRRTYSGGASHLVTISRPGLLKTVYDTSEAATGTIQLGASPDLTIGEKVTYRMTATLIEGTNPGVSFEDQLPYANAKFGVVSSRIVSIGTQLLNGTPALAGMVNASGTASDTDADGVMDKVVWTLGQIVNTPDGINDAGDQIVFEVVAVVLDKPLNQGGLTSVANGASLFFGGDKSTASATVDLVEPKLAMAKVPVPSPLYADAGDEMVFRIALNHTGASNADAFNLAVTDTLPATALWQNNATSTCPGFSVNATAYPTITFNVSNYPLTFGPCTIDYTVKVANTAQPSTTYENTANLKFESTPTFVSGQTRRDTSVNAKAAFTITSASLLKQQVATSLGATDSSFYDANVADVAIGENVDYELTLNLPEGNATSVVVTDSLPKGATGVMEALGGSIVSLGSNLHTSLPGTAALSDTDSDGIKDTVTFDFGSIANTPDGVNDAKDRLVLRITARVVNAAANTGGKTLTNSAVVAIDTTTSDPATAKVEVVEPTLKLTKTMGSLSGGRLEMGVQVENIGKAPAYSLRLEDALPSAIWDVTPPSKVVPVSVPTGFQFAVQNVNGTATIVITSDPANPPPANSVEPGEALGFVFSVPLAGEALPTTPVSNTVVLKEASSLPDNDPHGRPMTSVNATATKDVPRLSATKTWTLQNDADSSGLPSAGDTLRYTLVVTNSGTANATNVAVSDTPDAHTALVVGSVTASGGSVTKGNTAGDTGVVAVRATLTAGATFTVTYDVRVANPLPPTVAAVRNQAIITSSELPQTLTDDPSVPGTSDVTEVPVSSAANLEVLKTGPATAVPGGPNLIYQLTVTNKGPNAAWNATLVDPTPAGLSLVSVTGNCTAFPCDLGDMMPGDSLTVNATYAIPSSQNGTVANTATVSSPTPDPVLTNNNATATTQLTPQTNLKVTKVSNNATPYVGDQITFTITVVNQGPSDGRDVKVDEPMPTGYTYLSDTGGGAYVPSTGVWTVGHLIPGASAELRITVRVNATGVYSNTATVSGTTPETNATDNTDTNIPAPSPMADVTVAVAAPPKVLAGEQVSVNATWTNNGPSPAAGLTYGLQLGPNLTGVQFQNLPGGMGATYNPNTGEVTITGTPPTLASGASFGFQVLYTAPLTGSIPVQGTIGTTTYQGANVAPDMANASTNAGEVADLAITKTGPASVHAGNEATYTVTVTNHGPSVANNVVITEQLPDGATFISANGTCAGGFPCQIASLDVNATRVIAITARLPFITGTERSYTNSVNVTSRAQDPNIDNNTASHTIQVIPGVPTLSEWGMILFTALLSLAAMRRLRQRHQS